MLDDAALLTDSGGKVTAALNAIVGPDRIVRYVLGLVSKLPDSGIELELAEINGAPGLILYAGADAYCTMAFDYQDGAIAAVYMTVNPDKMRHLRRGHE